MDRTIVTAQTGQDQSYRPLFTCDKRPGDFGFVPMLDAMMELAYRTGRDRKGETLVYIGPDTHKFIDWTPIPNGVEVTVVGFIHCKHAIVVRLPCGVTVGMNIDKLAERVFTAG